VPADNKTIDYEGQGDKGNNAQDLYNNFIYNCVSLKLTLFEFVSLSFKQVFCKKKLSKKQILYEEGKDKLEDIMDIQYLVHNMQMCDILKNVALSKY
jgi:hypothetical protein